MTFTCYIPKDGKFNYLQALRLVDDISLKLSGNEKPLATMIKNSINGPVQVPSMQVIKELKEMIEDNEECMGDLLGEQLLQRIIAFK